jgi:putative membrane protein
MNTRRLLACFIAAACAQACDNNDTGNPSTGSPTTIRANNVRVLSDGQVGQVAITLNEGEVSAAQTAEPRLTQAAVRDFAQRMITEHSAANARLGEQFSAENLNPLDSPVSQALKQMSDELANQLRMQTSPQLDNTYVLSQVQMHAQALALIDCSLVPNARNEVLRNALVNDLRPSVQEHLGVAVMLRQNLGLPDNGEANLPSCGELCRTSTASSPLTSGQTPLPEPLRSAVCRD